MHLTTSSSTMDAVDPQVSKQRCVVMLENMEEFQMQFLFRLQAAVKLTEEQRQHFFGTLLQDTDKPLLSSDGRSGMTVTTPTVADTQFRALYADLLPAIEACNAERIGMSAASQLSESMHHTAISEVLKKHLQKGTEFTCT